VKHREQKGVSEIIGEIFHDRKKQIDLLCSDQFDGSGAGGHRFTPLELSDDSNCSLSLTWSANSGTPSGIA